MSLSLICEQPWQQDASARLAQTDCETDTHTVSRILAARRAHTENIESTLDVDIPDELAAFLLEQSAENNADPGANLEIQNAELDSRTIQSYEEVIAEAVSQMGEAEFREAMHNLQTIIQKQKQLFISWQIATGIIAGTCVLRNINRQPMNIQEQIMEFVMFGLVFLLARHTYKKDKKEMMQERVFYEQVVQEYVTAHQDLISRSLFEDLGIDVSTINHARLMHESDDGNTRTFTKRTKDLKEAIAENWSHIVATIFPFV